MPYVVPMRLEADGLPTLHLNQPGAADTAFLDLGDAVTREVVDNAPDANGTIDTTRYFGARSVAVTYVLEPTSDTSLWEIRNRLRAFTRPDLRPRLYLQLEASAPEVMLTLRRGAWSEPWAPDPPAMTFVQVQWVAPSGLIESAELHSVTAGAGGYEEQPGRTYDLTYPRVYPAADPSSGGALCVNAGNVPVWPKAIYMFGPASNGIVLRNDTHDLELSFKTTLSIAAGDWIKVDFEAKTIVNSTGTSYYDSLDFPASAWWQLQPGDNRVFMIPDTYTAPAAVQVDWHDGYL